MRWNTYLTALAVIAMAIPIWGCGDDDEPATTAEETTATTTGATGATGEDGEVGVVSNTVEVSITDDSLEPSNVDPESILPGETITSTAEAGEVTFEITNDGSEERSIVFNEAGKEVPLVEDLPPGESETATVDVTSGFYVYYDADQGPEGPKAQLEVND